MNHPTSHPHHPRSFATALVIWAIALAVLILSAIQLASWRQAIDGRETLARVRASWAARAGVESVIARLQQEADQAQPLGPRALLADLANVADGSLQNATFTTTHDGPTGPEPGPGDAHAKINVNRAIASDLMLIPNMTEDAADSIIDWIDTDEEAGANGAEFEAYTGLTIPYEPRNGPVPTLAELLLVTGVRSEDLFGDGSQAFGVLLPPAATTTTNFAAAASSAAGWSAYLTASSLTGGLSATGQARIDLATASSQDIESAIGVDSVQADAIIAHASGGGTIADFIRTDLRTLAQQARQAQGNNQGPQPQVANLTRDELALLLAECAVGDSTILEPGKLNICTAQEEVLDYVEALTPTIRDAIVLFRDQRGGDLTSIVDLLDIPQVTNAVLADLYPLIDVRSNVFQLRVVGRDAASGMSVEMFAEIDRSTQPVTIRSLMTR